MWRITLGSLSQIFQVVARLKTQHQAQWVPPNKNHVFLACSASSPLKQFLRLEASVKRSAAPCILARSNNQGTESYASPSSFKGYRACVTARPASERREGWGIHHI